MARRAWRTSKRTRRTRAAGGAGARGSIGAGEAAEPIAASPCETSAGGEGAVHGSCGLLALDGAGRPFIDALVEARSRGVQIRVLVDGIGSGYFFSPIVRRLRKEGVPVARFLHDWKPWRMPFLNLRNHKKILVVDGATGFTGGLNIGARFKRQPIVNRVFPAHVDARDLVVGRSAAQRLHLDSANVPPAVLIESNDLDDVADAKFSFYHLPSPWLLVAYTQ